MGKQKWLWVLLAIVLVFILLFKMREDRGGQRQVRERAAKERVEKPERRTPAETDERGGLNRNAGTLIYSKHARCRMDCRHISESEVMAILKEGKINYGKSDLRGQPDPKYALEGITNDGQRVRVIFANSPRGIVVVTVIDLENEWKCNCK